MLKDDERFRAVYAQVVRLWQAMHEGSTDEVEAATQRLQEYIHEYQSPTEDTLT